MFRRLLDIFLSCWQITLYVIFARRAQVLFYYPQHFNRSAEGTNPFFDPLLQACDEAGVRYKLLEEPDWGTDKPRNSRAIKADAFFVLVLLLRKVVKLCGKKDFYEGERHVAKIFNILTLGRFRYRRYVTISGSMQHLLLALNPNAIVYDLQHGVLCKLHKTFFDKKKSLRPIYKNDRLHWLMWGKGYKNSFVCGDEGVLDKRVHIIGYPVSSIDSSNPSPKQRKVLMSLQLTADYDQETLQVEKELVGEYLSQFEGTGYKVLIKHHPRYNNIISVDDWYERYDFIEETNAPLDVLVHEVVLQLTVYSTTVFEYASYGVPSYIMVNDKRTIGKDIFYDDFRYPLYEGKSLSEVLSHIDDEKNYKADCDVVKSWYEEFYSPFDKQAFLKLMVSGS